VSPLASPRYATADGKQLYEKVLDYKTLVSSRAT